MSEIMELIRKYEAEKKRLQRLSWCEDCEDIYHTLTELMDEILKKIGQNRSQSRNCRYIA